MDIEITNIKKINVSFITFMSINLSYHNLDILIRNLDIFNQRYSIIRILKLNQKRGVYEVYDNINKEQKVLKFIIKTSITNEQMNTYNFFLRCAHSNLCRIEEITESGIFLILIMEYIEGELMSNYFNSTHTHNEYYKLLFDLIFTLSYLHSNQIIHSDIKPDNIIIKQDGTAILIDYDLCRSPHKNNTTNMVNKIFGTKFFMAPELLIQKKLSIKIDIWSLGMSLCICAIKNSPRMFMSKNFLGEDILYEKIKRDIDIDLTIDLDNKNNIFKNISDFIQKYKTVLFKTYGKLFINLMIAMLIEDENLRPDSKILGVIIKKSKWYNIIYNRSPNVNNDYNDRNDDTNTKIITLFDLNNDRIDQKNKINQKLN